MMKKRSIDPALRALVETQCKRCDRPMMKTLVSLLGNDDLKARLGDICFRCVTPEEEREMNNAAMLAMHHRG